MVLLYVIAIANILAGCWLNIGLVYYEHSLPTAKRTLINRLLAQRSLSALLILVPGHIVIITVETLGKISDFICHTVVVFLLGMSISMFFFGNATMVLRYLFLAHFKNIAVIQDEFLHLFITLLAVLLSMYWSLLLLFTGGHTVPLYHYCTGYDAIGITLGDEKKWFIKLFLILSLLFHTIIYIMTRRHNNVLGSIAQGDNATFANVSLQESKGSFVKIGTMVKITFMVQLFIVVGGAAIATAVQWFKLSFRSVAPFGFIWQAFSIGICLPLIYYWYNDDLREKVTKMTMAKLHLPWP